MEHQVNSIKVDMRIDAAIYPALHKTLSAIPKRHRAEKIRQLTMLGLLAETNGFTQGLPAQAATNETPLPTQPSTHTQEPEADIGKDFSMY